MDNTQNSGIYCIENITNGKLYVGSSSNIRARWSSHRSNLLYRRHGNPHLQSAWDKYSSGAFQFFILEYCSPDQLLLREDWWIELLQSKHRDKGYNLKTAERRLMSDESRKKLSEACMGRPISDETKAKISDALRDRRFSKAHRDKLGQANRRRRWSQVSKDKLAEHRSYWWVITCPLGTTTVTKNLRRFCLDRGLDKANMLRVAKGKQSHHKGWTVMGPYEELQQISRLKDELP